MRLRFSVENPYAPRAAVTIRPGMRETKTMQRTSGRKSNAANRTGFAAVAVLLLATTALAGCTNSQGTITQAGSSTVLPIALAWAEEVAQLGISVAPAGGGSGAGASKLCAGEVDIGDMSREMRQSEIDTCRANGIDPWPWKVAFDGLTVVVNPDNDWVDYLSVEELRHIWTSKNSAQTWADVRDGWPDQAIVLYGPDEDSGTYEYFNEVILEHDCGSDGESVCIRDDFTPSADDNVLVEGVAQSRNGIGHFGFAYYLDNQNRIQSVAVQDEGAAEAVEPTFATIADGSYSPLSRPIFMVTDGKPAPDTPIHAYFTYAMNDGQAIIREVGYVELDQATLNVQRGWL